VAGIKPSGSTEEGRSMPATAWEDRRNEITRSEYVKSFHVRPP